MTQAPDHHEETADALKAIADGTHKAGQGSADGFVGPEEPEEPEEDRVEPVEGAPAAEPDSTGYDLVPDAADASVAPADLATRRRRSAEFDQRARLAHAHQYKTVMIPLLITLGAILMLMGIYVLIAGSGDPADQGFNSSFRRWFPILAFPLGAFLLAGAWWFHQDVTRKRK